MIGRVIYCLGRTDIAIGHTDIFVLKLRLPHFPLVIAGVAMVAFALGVVVA